MISVAASRAGKVVLVSAGTAVGTFVAGIAAKALTRTALSGWGAAEKVGDGFSAGVSKTRSGINKAFTATKGGISRIIPKGKKKGEDKKDEETVEC